MARKRMIDPSIWTDEGMALLNMRQQLLYIGLFSNADDEGRLKASAAAVRLLLPTLYPGTPLDEVELDILCVISAMVKAVRYEHDGNTYIAFTNYRRWQQIQHPTKSKLPPPPADPPLIEDSRQPDALYVRTHGGLNESSLSPHTQVNVDQIRLDQVSVETPTAAAEAPPEPVAAAESPPDGGALPRASPKPTTLNRQQLGRFERWYLGRDVAGYDGYPNKQQRPEAERAWRKLNPDDALTAQLIADVRERRTGRKWAEGFVDYPAKYLNQRIWEDDIEPCKQGTHHESTGRPHRGTGRQNGRDHRRGAVGAPGSLGPGGYDSWHDES